MYVTLCLIVYKFFLQKWGCYSTHSPQAYTVGGILCLLVYVWVYTETEDGKVTQIESVRWVLAVWQSCHVTHSVVQVLLVFAMQLSLKMKFTGLVLLYVHAVAGKSYLTSDIPMLFHLTQLYYLGDFVFVLVYLRYVYIY